MKEMDPYAEEQELLLALEKREVKAFLRLFKDYNDDLMIFAYSQLNNQKKAEETVQELFEELWSAGRFKEIKPPIYKFLVGELSRICESKISQ
ncbi:hypothetical protein [Puia dinghuensis]|nr:hypothetical protein [Puia dinghuensis]